MTDESDWAEPYQEEGMSQAGFNFDRVSRAYLRWLSARDGIFDFSAMVLRFGHAAYAEVINDMYDEADTSPAGTSVLSNVARIWPAMDDSVSSLWSDPDPVDFQYQLFAMSTHRLISMTNGFMCQLAVETASVCGYRLKDEWRPCGPPLAHARSLGKALAGHSWLRALDWVGPDWQYLDNVAHSLTWYVAGTGNHSEPDREWMADPVSLTLEQVTESLFLDVDMHAEETVESLDRRAWPILRGGTPPESLAEALASSDCFESHDG